MILEATKLKASYVTLCNREVNNIETWGNKPLNSLRDALKNCRLFSDEVLEKFTDPASLKPINDLIIAIGDELNKTQDYDTIDAMIKSLEVILPYVESAVDLDNAKKAANSFAKSNYGHNSNIPTSMLDMSQNEIEMVNAFKFLGIEIEYDTTAGKWIYSTAETSKNPNGFVYEDGKPPMKYEENEVNSFLDKTINNLSNPKTILTAENIFDHYAQYIENRKIPTLPDQQAATAKLVEYKKIIKISGSAWNRFNSTSPEMIARQAGQASVNELYRDAYTDMEKMFGNPLVIDKNNVTNISKVDQAIVQGLTGIANTFQSEFKKDTSLVPANDPVIDNFDKQIAALENEQAQYKDDSPEYKAISVNIKKLEDARQLYYAHKDFRTEFVLRYLASTAYDASATDKIKEVVEGGIHKIDKANLDPMLRNLAAKGDISMLEAKKFIAQLQNDDLSFMPELVGVISAKKANLFHVEMVNDSVKISKGRFVPNNSNDNAEDIANDCMVNINEKNQQAKVQSNFIASSADMDEFAKYHIPDILAYVMDGDNGFAQSFSKKGALEFYTHLFEPGNILDTSFQDYKAKNPKITDVNQLFNSFLSSVRSNLNINPQWASLPDYVFKQAYNDSRTNSADKVSLDATEQANIGKDDEDFLDNLAYMDMAAESFTPEEYSSFVDPLYDDNLRQILINTKFKAAKAKGLPADPVAKQTLIDKAVRRQKELSMYHMVEDEYHQLNQHCLQDGASQQEKMWCNCLKNYLRKRKENQENNNDILKKQGEKIVDPSNAQALAIQAGETENVTNKKYKDLYPQPSDHTKYLKEMSKYNKKAINKQFILPLLKAIQNLKINTVETVANQQANLKQVKTVGQTVNQNNGNLNNVNLNNVNLNNGGNPPQQNNVSRNLNSINVNGQEISRDNFESMVFSMGAEVLANVNNPQLISKLQNGLSSKATTINQKTFANSNYANDMASHLGSVQGFFNFLASTAPAVNNPDEFAGYKRELREVVFDVVSGKIKDANDRNNRLTQIVTKYQGVLTDPNVLDNLKKVFNKMPKEMLTYLLSFSSKVEQPQNNAPGKMYINSQFTSNEVQKCGDKDLMAKICQSRLVQLQDKDACFENMLRLMTMDMVNNRYQGSDVAQLFAGAQIVPDVSYIIENDNDFEAGN